MEHKFLYVGILTLLGYFACKDFFYRRVNNQVALASLFLGLLVSFFQIDPLVDSVSDWLVASILMFCFAFLFYFLGLFAAGDVKFSVVIGSLLGFSVQLFLVIFLSNLFVFLHALLRCFYKKFFWRNKIEKNTFFIPYAGYMAFSSMIVIAYYLV